MDKKKLVGTIKCSVGILMFIVGIILFLVSFVEIPGITKPIHSLFSILFGSTFSYTALLIFTIIMFAFGLFSILFGLLAFLEVTLGSIFISIGLSYVISSIFIFRLYNWARKLSIFISTAILLIYFISFLCLIFYFDYYGWGKFMLLKFSPYVISPLFFIIFLTRPKVKEQFKK